MKRRALIIGNMGIENSRLSTFVEGVKDDLANFYKFIRSDNGGAWNRDEVIFCRPNTINKTELLRIISDERSKGEVDYWLVFFSGHGWADRTGESYLEVCPREKGDSNISLTEFIGALGSTRVLLISDACRAIPIYESGGKLPTLKYFSDSVKEETNYRKECRKIYNQKILVLPAKTIYCGLSCMFGETSNDSGVYGGEYIHAVIEKAMECIAFEKGKGNGEERTSTYAYPFVHSLAKPIVVAKTSGTQTPVYRGPKTWQPPFCVIP